MSRREVIAYAITHAPKGVKGGPYEAASVEWGKGTAELRYAAWWPRRPASPTMARARAIHPSARAIRIVRKARPSLGQEASAVEVLRELASYPGNGGDLARIQARARAVIAASGPDPMPVVRAAMAYWDTGGSMSDGPLLDAADAYRKAGGK